MTSSFRLGIDIGGTFSDFALVDDSDGTIRVEKTLTSAHAPEESVMRGIGDLTGAIPDLLARTGEVIHATTLVTNVILERKGAKTGLLATEGFRDILELAREVRYDIYDMFIRLPEPMVPRRLRLGVPERVLADGTVLVSLDEAAVRRAAAVFRDEGVGAVAVSFLHSYRNGAHERRAAEILREALPDAYVSLSHEVHPEPKEYERTSTTVLDAYVKAVAEGYLERLARGLAERGYRERLFIMLSNGGTATVETAKRVPVQIVESGPAAGVEAAAYFGRLLRLDNLLSFDMGAPPRSSASSRTAGPPGPGPTRWTACTASRREAASPPRCRSTTSSRSARAAAASPGSTTSASSRSGPTVRAPRRGPRATASAAPRRR